MHSSTPVFGRVETDSLGYSLTSLREKGLGCLVFMCGVAQGTGPDLISSLYSRKETEREKKGRRIQDEREVNSKLTETGISVLRASNDYTISLVSFAFRE